MHKVSLINFIVMQAIILIAFFFIVFYLIRVMIANKYNKKFSQFVYSEIDLEDHSIEAKVSSFFKNLIIAISYMLNKFHLFKKNRLKYDKYLFINNYYLSENIDFISLKIIINFVVLVIISLFLLFSFTYYNLVIALLFIILVNFIIEIILRRYLMHYKRLLNIEILNTIHMINSGLNVGLSIMQSIKLAASKSNPLLAQELNMVSQDLNSGISIEKAFNRLYDRIKTSEVLYLATLLSVLNKSGGSTQASFKILEENYETKISYQKSINNLLFPYRYIFNFLGLIPLLVLTIRIIFNHDFVIKVFNSWYYLLLIFFLILYNVCYFVIVKNLLEVKEHE